MSTYSSSIRSILLFSIILFTIDLVWLIGANKLHKQVVLRVQHSSPEIRPLPALLFYLLAGIAFTILVSKESNSNTYLLKAMILGMFAYGTFDLTNLAIFKDYSVSYAIKDTLWGTFGFTLSAYLMKSFV